MEFTRPMITCPKCIYDNDDVTICSSCGFDLSNNIFLYLLNNTENDTIK